MIFENLFSNILTYKEQIINYSSFYGIYYALL